MRRRLIQRLSDGLSEEFTPTVEDGIMTRGRKFRSTRRTPESERSYFEQKLTGRYSRTLDRNDLLNLIRGGEDTYLEFKIRLVNTEKITGEIVAMANTGGGAIILGGRRQRP